MQTAISRGLPRGTSCAATSCATRRSRSPRSSGITIASLIALSAVVETAFGLNGLGAYLVQAAQNKDFAVVQGISLVLVAAFVVINTVVDIAYALLDPRVALGSRAAVSIHRSRRARSRRARDRDRAPSGVGAAARVGTGARRGSRGSASGSSRSPSLLAIFGPLLRPFDPNAVEPLLRQRRPVRWPPARLRRPGPRPVEPADGRRPHHVLGPLAVVVGRDRARHRRWPSSRPGSAAGRHGRLLAASTSCSRSPASCSPCWPPPCSARA